jgi:hypothetical protein
VTSVVKERKSIMKVTRYRYVIANLNTDESEYVTFGADLDRAVQGMLDAGIALCDIGISLEELHA